MKPTPGLKMKRYNCKHGPVDMIEEADGYWVTYDEYNQSMLDNNKLVEKSWRSRDSLAIADGIKEEKLQDIIVGLSIALFAAVVTLLFIWMRN
jgi:tetrahydromethanopterin S-methyltransferase subunit B